MDIKMRWGLMEGMKIKRERDWNVLMHMCESSTSFHCIKRGEKCILDVVKARNIASMEDVMRILSILFWRLLGLSGLMLHYSSKAVLLRNFLSFWGSLDVM
jgi:hypothetical protein